jgi:hypothetical protein
LHDQLNVLSLETRVINLFPIILIFVLLCFNGLALVVMIMIVACVVMAGSNFSIGELLGSGCLCLGVQVLDLSFTKDAGFYLASF